MPVLHIPRVGMVCVPKYPMLPALKRKIIARKRKKESMWRYPLTFSYLVAAASVTLLLLLAPLGLVEASSDELVHAYTGDGWGVNLFPECD
jgi:hypothetical protein